MSEQISDELAFRREHDKDTFLVTRIFEERYDVDDIRAVYRELEDKIETGQKTVDGIKVILAKWKSVENEVIEVENKRKELQSKFVRDVEEQTAKELEECEVKDGEEETSTEE